MGNKFRLVVSSFNQRF